MKYALVGPGPAVVAESTQYAAFDPSVATKQGYRWLPREVEIVGEASALRRRVEQEVIEDNRVVTRITFEPVSDEIRAAAVKFEAGRRILEKYPQWRQVNMLARSVELTRKGVALTAEEQAEAASLEAAWAWIKSVRTASDAIEALSPIPADFASDHRWPA